MKTMAISDENHERLKVRKKHDRQPYNDVLGEVLDKLEELESKETTAEDEKNAGHKRKDQSL